MLSYRRVFVLRRLPDGTIISIVGWKMLKAMGTIGMPRARHFKLQPESWSPWRTSSVSIWDVWGPQVREWCGCCQVDSQWATEEWLHPACERLGGISWTQFTIHTGKEEAETRVLQWTSLGSTLSRWASTLTDIFSSLPGPNGYPTECTTPISQP